MDFNMIEIAEKLNRGEISPSDEKVLKAESLISKLYETEEGRQELAEIVKLSLEDSYNKFDISPRIFETKAFKYGDRPLFKTHKKGIRAYWTAPNSYVPMSRNYDTEIMMEFEGLGVRPEALISELKTGRLSSFASLITDGRDAIETEILRKVYTVIAQAYNANAGSKGKDYYSTATNVLTKTTLDTAINKMRKKNGGAPTIIADYDVCTVIESFVGFDNTDARYVEQRDKGLLGRYKGCDIIYLPEILDPVTQTSIVPTDKVFVVSKKVGYAASYGETDVMQEQNINDKSWNCRIDKELGYVITKPEGIYCIQITS